MPRPKRPQKPPGPQRFLRAGEKRLKEGQFLLDAHYTTGAVYLAGYAVECVLKALVLSSEPKNRRFDTLRSFRGVRAHDFVWLRKQLKLRHVHFPRDVEDILLQVGWWTTELRYESAEINEPSAEEFLRCTEEIARWAKQKL
jgi:HEPN domain-containing protein